MTRAEAIAHNQKVVKNVINALVEFKLADPFQLMTDHQYAAQQFWAYIEAANVARGMMHMEPLVLYKIEEEDE